MSWKKKPVAFVSLMFLQSALSLSFAQSYPSKPISLVVPFSVGGPSDTSARLVANAMATELGAPIVVDNVPGAAAVIGTTRVANAKPDGYTILWGSGSSFATAPHLNKEIRYDPLKSFDPIGLAVSQPFVLVVSPRLGVKSVAELVELANSRPGNINYGSNGVGGGMHLAAELFKSATGMEAVHIPYSGGAPAMSALLAGDIDFVFDTTTITQSLVKSGKVIPLAVTSEKRWEGLPEVPTMAEVGVDGAETGVWFGLFAPSGTPGEVIDLLAGKLNQLLESESLAASLRGTGFRVESSTPASVKSMVEAEYERWGAVIKKANITVE